MEYALICLHKRLDCVNAKCFVIRLKASMLNRIQHKEKETQDNIKGELDFHWIHYKLFSFPGLYHRPFLIVSSFYILKAVKDSRKTWTTLLQIGSILTSYLFIRPNSFMDSLLQIITGLLQLQTQNLFSCYLAFTLITCTPKLRWSQLQITPGSGLWTGSQTVLASLVPRPSIKANAVQWKAWQNSYIEWCQVDIWRCGNSSERQR